MKQKVYLIASMVFLLSLFFVMSVSAGAEGNGSDTLIIKVNKTTAPIADEFGRVDGYNIILEDADDISWYDGYEYKMIFQNPAGEKKDIGSAFGTIFKGVKFVEEVYLTDTCDKIPANAFSGCTSLTTVTTGTNCNTIESGAFSGCTSLKSVGDDITLSTSNNELNIGEGWTIGENAFSGIGTINVIRWEKGTSTNIGDAAHHRLTVADSSHGATVLGDVNYEYTQGNTVFVRAGTSLATVSLSADSEKEGYYVTANGTKLSELNNLMLAENTTINAEKPSTETHTDYVEFNNVSISKYGDCYATFYFSNSKSAKMSSTIRDLFGSGGIDENSNLHFYINVTDIPADVNISNAKLESGT